MRQIAEPGNQDDDDIKVVSQCDICQRIFYSENVSDITRGDRPFHAKIKICDTCRKELGKKGTVTPAARIQIYGGGDDNNPITKRPGIKFNQYR